mgnify:FL=1
MKVRLRKESCCIIMPTLAVWWGQIKYNGEYKFSISLIALCFELEFLFFKKKENG